MQQRDGWWSAGLISQVLELGESHCLDILPFFIAGSIIYFDSSEQWPILYYFKHVCREVMQILKFSIWVGLEKNSVGIRSLIKSLFYTL